MSETKDIQEWREWLEAEKKEWEAKRAIHASLGESVARAKSQYAWPGIGTTKVLEC